MTSLYTAPGLTIWHDPPQKCLVVEWRGPHNGAEKQAGCLAIIQQLQQTASTRLLVDSSQDLDTWADAIYWLGHTYEQALVDNGLEAAAWVLPRYVRAQADASQVLHYIYQSININQQSLVVNTFQDIEAAHAWLRKQGPS